MSDPTEILKSHQQLQKTIPTFGLGLYVRVVQRLIDAYPSPIFNHDQIPRESRHGIDKVSLHHLLTRDCLTLIYIKYHGWFWYVVVTVFSNQTITGRLRQTRHWELSSRRLWELKCITVSVRVVDGKINVWMWCFSTKLYLRNLSYTNFFMTLVSLMPIVGVFVASFGPLRLVIILN